MEFKVVLQSLLKIFLDHVLKPILNLGWRVYYRKLDYIKPLPKCHDPLLFIPVGQLARKIRNREISSSNLVQAYINRIKELQPYLNFMVHDCFDEALEQAKKVDEILSLPSIPEQYSEENAPILGIPFSCKESFWVKGKPNSTGLVKRKDFRAPEDATIVKYMRQAGGIITCLTNTPELCMWFETSNYLYGTTRNPYNLSRIAGGSSGGEGCIVGSGASIVGIGSDIGGSIRIPSFMNGVYGHMPTPFTIDNQVQYPTSLQECMLGSGPICRYASDLKLIFKILCGPKYPEISARFESDVDVRKLKFYVIRSLQGHPLVTEPGKDAQKALDKAVTFIERNLGQPVRELRLNKLAEGFQMWSSLVNEGKIGKKWFSRTLSNDENQPVNASVELAKSIFGLQKEHTLPSILIALKEQLGIYESEKFIQTGKEFREEIMEILGNDGVIILPSFPVPPPYHNISAFCHNFDFVYFGIINVLGCPTTQCPMGISHEGLPTGIQVVSNRGNDHVTMRLAEIFENELGGWIKPF